MHHPFRILSRALPLLLLLAALAGCSFENPVEDFELKLNMPEIGTMITGQLQDGGTGEPIMHQPVNITILGEDADMVADFTFSPVTSFASNAGVISFTLIEDVEPTADDPIDFVVRAESDGYIKTSRSFHLTESGNYNFTLKLTNPSNPPQGTNVGVSNNGAAGSDGTVTNPVTLQTSGNANAPATTRATLNAGTRVLDANGTPLSGPLTATATVFNSADANGSSLFPGGMTTPDGAISCLGFVELEITDQSGRVAATFENGGLDVVLEVAPTQINAATGQPVQAGDNIPLATFDTDSGQWITEGTVTLSGPNGNGNYEAAFTTPHLSIFALLQSLGMQPLTVQFLGTQTAVNNIAEVQVFLPLLGITIGPVDFDLLPTPTLVSEGVYEMILPLVVPPFPGAGAQITFFSATGEPVQTSFVVQNPNGPHSLTVDVSSFDQVLAAVDVTFNASCADEPDVVFRPNVPVLYKRSTATAWKTSPTPMTNGFFSHDALIADTKYNFQFNHPDADPVFITFTAGQTTEIDYAWSLTEEFCNDDELVYDARLSGSFTMTSRTVDGAAANESRVYTFNQGGTGSWSSGQQGGGLRWYTSGSQLSITRIPVQTSLGTYTIAGNTLTFNYVNGQGQQVVETYSRQS